MVHVPTVIEACLDLVSHDHLRARLTLAALVQRLLEPAGYSTVIVGGTAVDAYVSGAFGTSEAYPGGWVESLDIDTVVLYGLQPAPTRAAVDILARHGFAAGKTGSSVRYPDLELPIDFVGLGLPDDYSHDHAYDLHFEGWEEMDLKSCVVAAPEDILFDYMESGWDTKHQRDWARALAIAAVFEDALDLGYLFTKAHWRQAGIFVPALEKVLRGEPLRP